MDKVLMEIKKRNILSEQSKSEGQPQLYKLSEKTIKILTDRIKDEYTAHYFYRAASNWCDDRNYKKASEFFQKEAVNELEHSEKIQNYMTGFNIIPQIPQAETKHSFEITRVYPSIEPQNGSCYRFFHFSIRKKDNYDRAQTCSMLVLLWSTFFQMFSNGFVNMET